MGNLWPEEQIEQPKQKPLKRFRIIDGHPNGVDEVEVYRYFRSKDEAHRVFTSASLIEEVRG
jgi:hypothetical protein